MKSSLLKLVLVIVLVFALGIFTGCAENNEVDNVENDSINVTNYISNSNLEPLVYSEALDVVKEKYALAEDLYGSRYFDYDSSKWEAIEEYPYQESFSKINNMDVLKQYFTERGFNDFLNNQGLIYKSKEDYYIILGGITEYYDNMVLDDLYIQPDKIQATYICDICEGGEVIEKEVTITFTVI